MTINHYPHESLSPTETSPDLHSQLDLEDRSQFIQDKEDIATESLDNRTIIKRFACGKKRLVVNNNLRIDYAHNSLQLSTPPGELIAIHKIAARLHYILVKKDKPKFRLMVKDWKITTELFDKFARVREEMVEFPCPYTDLTA